jgi:hypothetical protein
MSVAFTSDAKGRWAADWLTWPGFTKFWAQVMRNAMRKSEAKGIVMQVEARNRRATVSLDAIDLSGKFLNNAETSLTVIAPLSGTRTLEMTQTAPGRYQAEFETPDSGSYHMEFSQKYQGKVLYHQSRGLTVGYPLELRLRGTNSELLKSIASVSGGQYDTRPESVFASTTRSANRASPLWPYLVAAAALLFVADVALRRIDFSIPLVNWRRRISLSSGAS